MEEALGVAERATRWLESGGGWAMFVLACFALYFMVRYIRDQAAQRLSETVALKDAHALKVEALAKEHKAELAAVERDHREQILVKDRKIFDLLDKTNELLKEIQARRQ